MRLTIFLITIIIIKLSIRITSLQIREKYNQIILSITSNQHKPYEENLGFEFYLGKWVKKVNKKII